MYFQKNYTFTSKKTILKTKKYSQERPQYFQNYMAKKCALIFFGKGNNLKEVKPTLYHDVRDHKLLF